MTSTRSSRSQLIDTMSRAAGINKTQAEAALKGFEAGVTEALKGGSSVQLTGFGTFSVKDRAARIGRNPKTGEPLEIAAKKVPQFKAGSALKDGVS